MRNGPKRANYDGRRYNSWTIISRVTQIRAIVRCDCGWQGERNLFCITRGVSRCCRGCATQYQHGWSGTPEHAAWLKARSDGRIPKTWTFDDFKADLGPRPGGSFLVPINKLQPLGPGNARWGRRSDVVVKYSNTHQRSQRPTRDQFALLAVLSSGRPMPTRLIAGTMRMALESCYERLCRLRAREFVAGNRQRLGRGGECYWRLTQHGAHALDRRNGPGSRR